MRQENSLSHIKSFRNIAFSDKVRNCLNRAKDAKIEFGMASWKESELLLSEAGKGLTLASLTKIQEIYQYNPDVLRIARYEGKNEKKQGLFCYLPLNECGAEAVANGTFDGKAPKTDWICKSGVAPVAVYIWLVYMPGSLGQTIGVIAQAFDVLAPDGCPVFSRAVNAHAERLNRTMGFLDAAQFYPQCAPGLLVIFPQKVVQKPSKARTSVSVARDISDIVKVFAVRSATYLADQFCLYEEEFDGNDFCATHLLGTIDGDAAGCVRIRFFAGFAKIERLAVRTEYRKSRLAFDLARAAVEHCRLKGYTKIYGHSRLDLVRFWKIFGFRVREDGRDFGFANIRYVEIINDQKPLANALTLDAEPLVLIRPEGAWDRPGPLDRSGSEADPMRRSLLINKTRTVRGMSVARAH